MDNPILIVIAFITFLVPLFSLIMFINTTKKYSKIETKDSTSGCEIALKILEGNGINMYVIESNGIYNNMYDVSRNVIKLDKNIFHKSNISANALSSILASEVLLSKNNKLIKLKNFLLPIVNYLTIFAYIFLIVSIISKSFKYIEYSVLVFFVIVLFYLLIFSLDVKVIKKAKLELKKNKLIKKSEIDIFDEALEKHKYYHLSSVYLIIINNIKRLFN